jgi:hypothetical protein
MLVARTGIFTLMESFADRCSQMGVVVLSIAFDRSNGGSILRMKNRHLSEDSQ